MIYRKEIDGLRALAIIPIIFFHANLAPFQGGYIGVDVFFVISGYLITNIIIDEIEQKKFSISNFHERRARRIMPALIVVTLTSSILSIFFMYPYQILDFANSIFFTSTLTSNFYFWQNTGGYFSGTFVEQMPLLHTWSIAVQEQFYIFFPLFFLLIWRLGYKIFFFSILLITLISFSISEFASTHNPRANFFLIVTRVWEILIGSMSSIYLLKIRNKNYGSEIFSIIGISIIIIPFFIYDKNTPFPSIYTLLPTIGTLLIIIFCNNLTKVGKFLSYKPLVKIGLISYGIYLWHQPLLAFSKIYFDNSLSNFFSIIVCLISLIFAYITWRFIEIPFRNKNIINKKFFLIFVFFSFLFMIGYYSVAIKSKGFVKLWPLEDRNLVATHPLKSANYVREKFDTHRDNIFLENGKKNLLIIGDSQAQDFTNLIYEAGYNFKLNISTRHIFPRCGNLFVDKEIILNLKKYNPENCNSEKYYDLSLKNLIKKADYIFLISSWEYDEVKYIPLSIKNIKKITNSKVYVVSRKSFPNLHWSTHDLVKIGYKKRASLRMEVNKEHIKTHEYMKNYLDDLNFINLHDLLCKKNKCPIFDQKANLLSYDGSHFTKKGAKFMLNLINKNKLFLKIFE